MKKTVLFLMIVLCLAAAALTACAEEADLLGTWYYVSYETEDYPGVVFTADGGDLYFTLYTDGKKLAMADYRYGRETLTEAAFEDGVLTAGFDRFTLENGNLVSRYEGVTEVYSGEPSGRQIPGDKSADYAKALRPEHYDGTWVITRYGMNNAYAGAETMGLSGKAVIRDGVMTLDWSRNGEDKHFEITFDRELNKGRLYTVVNGVVSYIVSLRADHTILLNVGLNQAQWVMKKENVIDESVVHVESPDFEKAFAGRESWTDTEEERNELAKLLLDTAAAGGLDPAVLRTDGPFYLALIGGETGFPAVVCEGTGEYAHYLLTAGRGVSQETGEPFVYYRWKDCFFTSLCYPDTSVAEQYRQDTLRIVAGEETWPVRPGAE